MSHSEPEAVAPGRRRRLTTAAALTLAACLIALPSSARETSAVRAVLFFLPECGHCEYVINEVLPGVFAAVGERPTLRYDETIEPGDVTFYLLGNEGLELLLVDASHRDGAELFAAATTAFAIESLGVPRLIVGDLVLIGSVEIPGRLPGIIEEALRAGTPIDWPRIPGLDEVRSRLSVESVDPPTTTIGPTPTTSPDPFIDLAVDEPVSPWARFRTDPVGNSIAVAVLLVMVAATLGSAVRIRSPRVASRIGPIVPALAVAGLAVAAYLTFVEVGDSSAVCGPVGDCNAVQQSEYSRLFGVIPIGLLGVIAYSLILVAAVIARRIERHRDPLTVGIFGLSAIGVLFSMYLTFLEPFVIGATCAWCLTSALITTMLLWVATPAGVGAWKRLHSGARPSQLTPVP